MLLDFVCSFLLLFPSDTLKYSRCGHIDFYDPKRHEIDRTIVKNYENVRIRCFYLRTVDDIEFGKVKYLDVYGNPLQSLDKINFDSLVHLNISETALRELPLSLCNATKLKYIDARGAFLKGLPDCMCEKNNLEVLNSSWIMAPLPDNIKLCRNLRNISISFLDNPSSYKETLDKISQLPSLSRLGLYNVDRIDLPVEFSNRIEALSLWLASDKNLLEIIEQLSKWKNLKELQLMINSEALPKEIVKLQNLETLIAQTRAKGNFRIILPVEINLLKNLKLVHDYANQRTLKLRPEISIMRTNLNRDSRYERRGHRLVEYRDINDIVVK